MRRGSLAIIGAALAAGLVVGAPPAAARQGADDPAGHARGGGGAVVRAAGSCTLSSTAKLKLKLDDGRVEVEFEVDENRNGSLWGVVLKRNGTRVLGRAAKTHRPSGSFEVRALIARGTPRTKVAAVARRAATGEICRATATL
jgi:hypothetical protein